MPPRSPQRMRGQQAAPPVPHRQPPVACLPLPLAGVGRQEEHALAKGDVHGAGPLGLQYAGVGGAQGRDQKASVSSAHAAELRVGEDSSSSGRLLDAAGVAGSSRPMLLCKQSAMHAQV